MRSLGWTLVILIACSLDGTGALGAVINPTGREIELQVPLVFNGQASGSLLLSIGKDDRISFEAAGLQAVLGERLTDDSRTRVESATIDGRLTPDRLEAAGLPTAFDPASLSLSVDAPVDMLERRRIGLGPSLRRRPPPVEPESVSAYANLGLSLLHDRRQDPGGDVVQSDGLRLGLDGLVRLGGPVLAYELLQRIDDEGSSALERRSTALLLDVPRRDLRVTIGDLGYTGRGLQRNLSLLGIGLGRDFAMSDSDGARVTASRSLELARPSRVEVKVGDRIIDTLNLPAGTYDIADIPLALGANDVILSIEDDTGNVERIVTTELFDNALLPIGRVDAGLGIGVLARPGERSPQYSADAPVLAAYLRRGLSGGSTVGLDLQAGRFAWRLGTHWLKATRLGALDMLAALSREGNDATGFALGLDLRLAPPRVSLPGTGRFDLRLLTRSESFISAGERIAVGRASRGAFVDEPDPSTGNQTTLSLGYSGRFRSSGSFNLVSVLAHDRRGLEIATAASVFDRFPGRQRLGWSARLRYTSRDASDDELDLLFGLTWQPASRTRVTLDHALDASTTRIGLQRNDGGARVGAYGIDVSAVHAPGSSTALDARLSRRFNRFDVLGSWRESRTGTLDDGLSLGFGGTTLEDSGAQDESIEDDDDRSRSALVRLDTAIGFAGGTFAIGRPVGRGFAIISAHPTLEGRAVAIDPREGGFSGRTSAFGPALVSAPSLYRSTSIAYQVDDLPLGYDIGSGVFTLRSPLGAGYRLEVGSAARSTAVGTLVDATSEEPITLVSGNAVAIDDPERAPIQFFSSGRGRFAVAGLLPGAYWLVLDSVPERRARLEIPADATTLVRVGKLPVP